MRLHRIGSRPAKGVFGSFLARQKGTRMRSGRKLCTCLSFFARRVATLMFEKQVSCRSEVQRQGFRAIARLTFVLAKVSKTVFTGRDPPRYGRGGPLRLSVDGARSPNSLRSDMGCSTTPTPCDARLAQRLKLDQERCNNTSNIDSRSQKAKGKTKVQQRKARLQSSGAEQKCCARAESDTFRSDSCARKVRQLSTLPAMRKPATHTPTLDPILASRKLSSVRETRLRYHPRTVPASSRSDMKSL